ncbi:subtilisin-like protein [Thozetella sp. PMI_491]|nr:subtilisin-like protein [Thozetella sp. PMI_491]
MASTILRSLLAATLAAGVLAEPAKIVEGAFIIKLAQVPHGGLEARDVDHHALFHKRAAGLDYTVRQEFKTREVFHGLSVHIQDLTVRNGHALLSSIEGVEEVSPVYEFSIPHLENTTAAADPELQLMSFEGPAQKISAVQNNNFTTGTGSLGAALQAGGVDKLHELGIKGKGITIGIIDTGVDYRHPALGGGMGPGYKILGGHSWVDDTGKPVNIDDPLSTCYGGSHGTHVAGIVGMNPLSAPEGLPLSGVAPEASIRMYRIFNCAETNGTSDLILAAMSRAYEDGVDLVSMSLSTNERVPINGLGDPLADAVKALTDAGIGVVAAESNSASGGAYARNLYTSSWPALEATALGVGSVANLDYPLTYGAKDSAGTEFQYGSIYPIPGQELDVYLVDDGGSSSSWQDAINAVTAAGKMGSTVFAVEISDNTRPGDTTVCCVNGRQPVYVMGLWDNTAQIYNIPYLFPTQSRIGSSLWVAVNIEDSANLLANYNAAGGFGNYKITFPESASYSSPPQITGGYMDYYSSFGPVVLNYTLKPEISAPGGNILSTYPIGQFGYYAILSGTSMATPYIAGCYALVKSQFPNAKPEEIKAILQKSAKPLDWINDHSILSATAQQGAGLVNAYASIMSETDIWPGHIQVEDVTHSLWGVANVTITNKSQKPKTYSLGHKGAGYEDYYLDYMERAQLAKYGSANFGPSDTIEVAAGESAVVSVKFDPPSDVSPKKLPVFGGFVTIQDSDGESFSIPYIGPPYSLYNTPQINVVNTSTTNLPFIYFYPDGQNQVIVKDFIEVNNSMRYGSAATFSQWTYVYRVDILPANTPVVPNTYGFDPSNVIAYQPPSTPPKTTFLGYPSYGKLIDLEALTSPANNPSPNGNGGFTVTACGQKYQLGPGDYRWLVSVLRWGGDKHVFKDYDTWLGPVIRLTNGTVN